LLPLWAKKLIALKTVERLHQSRFNVGVIVMKRKILFLWILQSPMPSLGWTDSHGDFEIITGN
jgi:hypothetical protein